MVQISGNLSAEELALLPSDGRRYELVEGILHMMSPAGGRHGLVAGNLFLQIANHVKQHRLGRTFAAETGFLIRRNPDTVRAPDVAYVSNERLLDQASYWELAPDLVGEVLSPSDCPPEVESKVSDWLSAGVKIVLVVDFDKKLVRDHRAADDFRSYRGGTIDLGDLLPGLSLDVAELFS